MIDNTERMERMKTLLATALHSDRIDIADESHKHAGHAGARNGMGHFKLTIISPDFVDKTLIQRHRMVYDALGDMMRTDIHALSITAKTPDD